MGLFDIFKKENITSEIGYREQFGKFHNGTDFRAAVGTQIPSVSNGTVVKAQELTTGFGKHVVVEDSAGNRHTYAHMSKIGVNVGDTVTVGTVLGLSGNTGNSTGPHVHYEVRNNENAVMSGLNFIDTATKYYDENGVPLLGGGSFGGGEEGKQVAIDAASDLDGWGQKIVYVIALLVIGCGASFFLFQTFDTKNETGVIE